MGFDPSGSKSIWMNPGLGDPKQSVTPSGVEEKLYLCEPAPGSLWNIA